jgi:hypothetical protein|tara:strand:- start:106 stop:321 length:216 start_codon:yes stop_codon:yes gene_type:complete
MAILPDSKFIDTYYFNNRIEKELEEVKLNLASGSCTSYDEYKYIVGIIEGMEKSKNILQDIVNQFDENDEE